jgi:hypothetical protein
VKVILDALPPRGAAAGDAVIVRAGRPARTELSEAARFRCAGKLRHKFVAEGETRDPVIL